MVGRKEGREVEGREKRKMIQGRVEGRNDDKKRSRKFIDV